MSSLQPKPNDVSPQGSGSQKKQQLPNRSAETTETEAVADDSDQRARIEALKKDLEKAPSFSAETPIHDLSDTAILHLRAESMRNLRGKVRDGHDLTPKEVWHDSTCPQQSLCQDGRFYVGVRMEFTRDLATGLDVIDIQHREYFLTMNSLLDKCAAGMNPNDLSEAFHFLDFFTIHHFRTEEDLMREYDYPGYAEHHARHQEFRIELNNLKKRFRHSGLDDRLLIRLNYLLVEWFVKQVQEDDKKLSRFLRQKAAQNKSVASRLATLVKNLTHYSKGE